MANVTKEFVTAGRAIFTVEVPDEYAAKNNTKPHYTYKVKFKKGTGSFKDAYFLSLLTGPENTSDYTYVGMLEPSEGKVRLTGKSKYPSNSFVVRLLERVLLMVWSGTTELIEESGFKLHHEGRCGRCGRLLTVPESIETGIGPECIKHMGGRREKI